MIKLRTKIIIAIVSLAIFWGLVIAVYGYGTIKRYIIREAQERVQLDLEMARKVFLEGVEEAAAVFPFINSVEDLPAVKERLDLDYLFIIDRSRFAGVPSEVVRSVIERKVAAGAARIMASSELAGIRPVEAILIRETPRARESDRTEIRDVLVLEYAYPIMVSSNGVERVVYGGRVVNGNRGLVDDIARQVFSGPGRAAAPSDTVTICQDDVRVATNARDAHGDPAVGTRVSQEVYHQVVEQGRPWLDRAFVINDWYLTAYEPLRDVHGQIIGIFSVGILERPFYDVQKTLLIGLFMIFLVGVMPTMLAAYILANSLVRPLTGMAQTTARIVSGDLERKIEIKTGVHELHELTNAFNNMSERLVERERNLAERNEDLAVMNKRYLDMIGFVSHELKVILSSIVLNTYLLRKKILGDINEKQENVLKSMSRNLDYLTVTVKNFLNLSRIEKGEMKIEPQELSIREHLLDPAIEAFQQQIEERHMRIENAVPEGQRVSVDPGLIQIVLNNLLSNALKYGREKGLIRISSVVRGTMIAIEVYNDGDPIDPVDLDKLFKKFSRVIYRGMEGIKGTGIGLFICKEIVEKHGGRIWVEPREHGNAFTFEVTAIQ